MNIIETGYFCLMCCTFGSLQLFLSVALVKLLVLVLVFIFLVINRSSNEEISITRNLFCSFWLFACTLAGWKIVYLPKEIVVLVFEGIYEFHCQLKLLTFTCLIMLLGKIEK